MANMDYCKFENTLGDLRQCYADMDIDDDASDYEKRARESLLLLCKDIAGDYAGEIEEILKERQQKAERRAALLAEATQ